MTPQPGGGKALRRAMAYLRPFWRDALGALMALVMVSAANLVAPQMVRLAIDGGIAHRRRNAVILAVRRARRGRDRARAVQLPAGLPRRARLAGRRIRPARRPLRADPAPQFQLLRPRRDRATAYPPDERCRAGAHLRRERRRAARLGARHAARLHGAPVAPQLATGARRARVRPAALLLLLAFRAAASARSSGRCSRCSGG